MEKNHETESRGTPPASFSITTGTIGGSRGRRDNRGRSTVHGWKKFKEMQGVWRDQCAGLSGRLLKHWVERWKSIAYGLVQEK